MCVCVLLRSVSCDTFETYPSRRDARMNTPWILEFLRGETKMSRDVSLMMVICVYYYEVYVFLRLNRTRDVYPSRRDARMNTPWILEFLRDKNES